jgi:hypothetical protein
MAFVINFKITADPKGTMAKILSEAGKAGIHFEGNDQQGTFRGHNAAGSFNLNGHQLQVTVTDKPFLIPESLIRKVVTAKVPDYGLVVI